MMPCDLWTASPASAGQEELQQHRKTLRVCLGASQPSQPPPTQQPGGPLRPGKQAGQQQQQGGGGGAQPPSPQQQQQSQQQQQQNGSGGSLADTVKNNPVISKYFAVRHGTVYCLIFCVLPHAACRRFRQRPARGVTHPALRQRTREQGLPANCPLPPAWRPLDHWQYCLLS